MRQLTINGASDSFIKSDSFKSVDYFFTVTIKVNNLKHWLSNNVTSIVR